MCVKLQILTENGSILNIRRGEGLGDGIGDVFFKELFWGLGTHNLRKATKMSYKATKKIHSPSTPIIVLGTN